MPAISYNALPTSLKKINIKALADMGYKQRDIQKLTRSCSNTVVQAKREPREKMVPELIQRIKEGIVGKFYQSADLSLENIINNPDKLKRAGVSALAMAAGICVDKARLIEGSSTQRIEIHSTQEQSVLDKLAELQRELSSFDTQLVSEPARTEIVPARRKPGRPRKLAVTAHGS